MSFAILYLFLIGYYLIFQKKKNGILKSEWIKTDFFKNFNKKAVLKTIYFLQFFSMPDFKCLVLIVQRNGDESFISKRFQIILHFLKNQISFSSIYISKIIERTYIKFLVQIVSEKSCLHLKYFPIIGIFSNRKLYCMYSFMVEK